MLSAEGGWARRRRRRSIRREAAATEVVALTAAAKDKSGCSVFSARGPMTPTTPCVRVVDAVRRASSPWRLTRAKRRDDVRRSRLVGATQHHPRCNSGRPELHNGNILHGTAPLNLLTKGTVDGATASAPHRTELHIITRQADSHILWPRPHGQSQRHRRCLRFLDHIA